MNNELQKAQEAYHTADENGKQILINIFGQQAFEKPSTDWIEMFESFCKKNNIKAKLPWANPVDDDEESDNAYKMLKIITKWYRKDWRPNWKDGSQKKWFPVFDCSSASGFDFSATYCDFTSAYTGVGSRLCFPTEEMASEVAKAFLPIWRKFYIYS